MKFNSQNSFSLIELLIVIAVIGILALLAMPALKGFQSTLGLNGTVRDLVSDLRLTQQLAISEQVEYCLSLPDDFPSDRKYQILKCDQVDVFKEKLVSDGIIGITIIPDLSNNDIRYNPYGAVRESAQIIFTNSYNEIKTVDVRPSGFVKIIN